MTIKKSRGHTFSLIGAASFWPASMTKSQQSWRSSIIRAVGIATTTEKKGGGSSDELDDQEDCG